MPSGKPGKFSTSGGDGELPARFVAFDDERLQIRSGGVDGGGVSGAAGANDHNVAHEIQVGTASHAIRCKKGVRVFRTPFLVEC